MKNIILYLSAYDVAICLNFFLQPWRGGGVGIKKQEEKVLKIFSQYVLEKKQFIKNMYFRWIMNKQTKARGFSIIVGGSNCIIVPSQTTCQYLKSCTACA